MGEQVTYSTSEAVEEASIGVRLEYFEKSAFDAVLSSRLKPVIRTRLFSGLARFNTLYMISRAGSGHLGSSFSSLDIVSWLHLNVLRPGDRYFSSKGHDAPGLYAVQTGLGILPFSKVHELRRLGGLPGHPDIGVPGTVTNTGSLGMGVSKAKGFLFADELLKRGRHRVFVLTGDGELQEGQFWESLLSASRRRDGRLTVIIDHNKLQSDTYVSAVSDLGDLEAKFHAFGWEACRIDGHNLEAIRDALTPTNDGRPKAIIADTIKGRGVSFMEHTAMAPEQVFYSFHSGAPSPAQYEQAAREILSAVTTSFGSAGLAPPIPAGTKANQLPPPANAERLVPAYTNALIREASSDPTIVALDADLILDTGLIDFQRRFADRFVECGIAEQDMVSQAGAMALAGLVPVVHSFACFLTSRPAEQIYNNCTERTKIIYVGTLAGLLPSGPGHSHQSVRDVATMSGCPELVVIEPFCTAQVHQALSWALRVHGGSCYIRLTSVPYETRPEIRNLDEPMVLGQGHVLRQGNDISIIVANPILVREALKCCDLLAKGNISAQVIAMPWLNRFDVRWFADRLPASVPLITLESHYADCGFGARLAAELAEAGQIGGRVVRRLGLHKLPACGRNAEVLEHHGLDAKSLSATVTSTLKNVVLGKAGE